LPHTLQALRCATCSQQAKFWVCAGPIAHSEMPPVAGAVLLDPDESDLNDQESSLDAIWCAYRAAISDIPDVSVSAEAAAASLRYRNRRAGSAIRGKPRYAFFELYRF
jgi:hypothetical protein